MRWNCLFLIVIYIFRNVSSYENHLKITDHIVLLRFYQDTQGDQWRNNGGWKQYIDILLKDEWMFENNRNLAANSIPQFLLKQHFRSYQHENQTQGLKINEDLKRNNINICKSLFGIKCSPENQLTEISMESNHLRGTLSEYLPFLNDLVVLNLTRNTIGGRLPTLLLSVPKKLEILDLSNNQINRNIPFVNAPSLRILNLSNNKLNSYLPKAWNATQLEYMNLSNNQLSGVVPKTLFKHKLLSLDISRNYYLGYIPILTKAKLEHFNFSYNRMMDNITFSSLWKSNLITVDAESNQLTGFTPDNLLDNAKFTFINLKKNPVDGYIPSVVECNPRLTILVDNSNHTTCKPYTYNASQMNPSGGFLTISGRDFGVYQDLLTIQFSDGTNCADLVILKSNRILMCKYTSGFKSYFKINYLFKNTSQTISTVYQRPVIDKISKLSKNQSGQITITGSFIYSFQNDITIDIGKEKCIDPKIINNSTIICNLKTSNLIIMPALVIIYIDKLLVSGQPLYFYYEESERFDIECSTPASYSDMITLKCPTLNLTNAVQVFVDGYDCKDLIKSKDGSEIKCLPDPGVSGRNRKVMLVVSNDQPYYRNCLSYPPPLISRALGVPYDKGGIVTITGHNLKGAITNVSVQIGDRMCCPLFDNMMDNNFQCYLPPYSADDQVKIREKYLSILNQPVEIEIDGQITRHENIYSDIDSQCLDQCVLHHTRGCKSGICDCYPNFSGPTCERDITTTNLQFHPEAIPSIALTYPEYISEYTFDVAMLEIVEFSDQQNKQTYSDLHWQLNFQNETTRVFSCKLLPYHHRDSPYPHLFESSITVTIDYNPVHRNIYFAGEMQSIPKLAARYLVEITNWKFRNIVSDHLQLGYRISAPNRENTNLCSPKPTIKKSDSPLRWLTMSISDITLYHKIPQRVMIDGLVRNISSIMQSTNDLTSVKLYYTLPPFTINAVFQSDFSAIMEINYHVIQKQDGCFVDKTRKFPDIKMILFFVSLVFILIMIALIIQCSRVESRERKKLLQTYPIKNDLVELLSSPAIHHTNHPQFNILNFNLDDQNINNNNHYKNNNNNNAVNDQDINENID
ncbi:leucine-rich repeat-containing protein (LRR) [Tieghemostelium lacteum]|uniref:Leucine-rich repeat-containing protein (LRR) n=1 Tax=Tieghemostelium lacteum TaxID=361077 RepID=A0A151ZDC0_TIELA|nr:leucine-rich repeat-containing protein (LRR) [Tieghemostelium lacteum]|eukprot:KYQ91952.1 leucine-rich repeat-containing protein (LRR) [Tieghemostelium lacteum]